MERSEFATKSCNASNVNGTIAELQQTQEFQRLSERSHADVEMVLKTVKPGGDLVYDKEMTSAERLEEFGKLLRTTLLAYEHRGGYLVDTGVQTLIHHFEEDTGIRAQDVADAFEVPSFKKLLQSKGLERAVKLSYNDENRAIFKGQNWEDDFLSQLLVEQKCGESNASKRELDKRIDRAARMDAASLNPESIDARLRLYECMHNVGAIKSFKPYQEVQTEYAKIHGVALNKAELKKIFGVGEAAMVLEELCFDDVQTQKDAYRTGFIHVTLKRPLAEIKEKYEAIKEELKNIAKNDDIKQLHRHNNEFLNRERSKSKKKTVTYQAPEYVDNTPDYLNSGFTLPDDETPTNEFAQKPSSLIASQLSNIPPSGKLNQAIQKRATTVRGPGVYSDEEEDSDDELEAVPAASKTSVSASIKIVESAENTDQRVKVNRNHSHNSNNESDDQSTSSKPTKKAATSNPIPIMPNSIVRNHLKPIQETRPTENASRNQIAKQSPVQEQPTRVFNSPQQTEISHQKKSKKSSPRLSIHGPLNDRQTASLVKAYITGYLKAIQPNMFANTVVLGRRVVAYLKEENISVDYGEIIEFMVTYMTKQLSFADSKLFVGLSSTK
ncbi:hypothetical protein M3Y98_00785400 [Aphelenchoides besseyi]|nr:hypothetical protein M3Y98_00785400 [Aphelenchoides besseyi]